MMKMMQFNLIFTTSCRFIHWQFCSSSFNREASVSLVQGASRGIGLEFVKQLLSRDQKGHVLATCRNPDQSTGLQELKNQYSDRLKLLKVDVTDENSIEHMWPLLKSGGKIGTARDAAVVENLSARVGSIGEYNLGGWHSYRASKTALNQSSVEFARKKDLIICLLLHPGTVDTDLSQPFQRNVPKEKLFTKEFSVNKLLSIIDGAKIHDNGKFFAWDGQEIPR